MLSLSRSRHFPFDQLAYRKLRFQRPATPPPLENIQKKLELKKTEYYLHGKPATTLSVDATRSAALDISFDLTMHRLPCSWLSLDAMDVTGTSELDVSHHVHKRRIDPAGHGFMPDDQGGVTKVEIGPSNKPGLLPSSDGTPSCGSCYGAGLGPSEVVATSAGDAGANATDAAAGAASLTGAGAAENLNKKPRPPRCCTTCDDVRNAYRLKGWKMPDPLKIKQCHDEEHPEEVMQQKGEGCHIWGSLRVAKVAGSFHVAPGCVVFFHFSFFCCSFGENARERQKKKQLILSSFLLPSFHPRQEILEWPHGTHARPVPLHGQRDRRLPHREQAQLRPALPRAAFPLRWGALLFGGELCSWPRSQRGGSGGGDARGDERGDARHR